MPSLMMFTITTISKWHSVCMNLAFNIITLGKMKFSIMTFNKMTLEIKAL